ncbi:MAG: galactokinase family protein [Flavobacteriaceae bacterium]
MISVKAPARICFFGDHQDYLDLPVIAGTINRYIYIQGKPNNKKAFFIQLTDVNIDVNINLNENFNIIKKDDYLRSVLFVLKKAGFTFEEGYDVEITGNIPINAGLSSSSSLVVAWIRFLLTSINRENEVSDKHIGEWAYAAEVTFFNQPGGLMDQYTIAQGGLLFIDTLSTKVQRLRADFGSLVIAESGIAKQTLSVLQNARSFGCSAIAAVESKVPGFNIHQANRREYKKHLSHVPQKYRDHWYAAIHNHLLTQKARTMLSGIYQDLSQLGTWMNAHQQILEDRIQNTPLVMQKQIRAAREAGALGAKIIGSGGGGCMVAMVSDNTKEKVIQAFLNTGAKKAYEISLTSHS